MKKIFLLVVASVLVFSCTKDIDLADSTADLSATLASYDDTNMGIYKGVFAIEGTTERGTVEINVTPKNYATATITMISGQQVSLKSSQIVEAGDLIENLEFKSSIALAETSFLLSIEIDGTNVEITNVVYNGATAGMIAAHDTSRAPVVPITGVLACDDCDAHPLLVTGNTGTMSFIYVNDGSTNDSLTAMVDVGVILSNGGTQFGCVNGGASTTCNIAGGGTFGTNVVSWSGTHTYDNVVNCSEAAGTWSLVSGNHGSFTGTFTSDVTCTTPAFIGEFRDGGVVFWVDPTDSTHGLICAINDAPTPLVWGCDGTDLPNVPNADTLPPSGPGSEIGDGISNTNGILNDCPTAPAALAARSLGVDWFLPSFYELYEMYDNKAAINATATSNGGASFQNDWYWSSTEITRFDVLLQLFTTDVHSSASKSNIKYVRAVKAF